MKKIIEFIRRNEDGTYELIIWMGYLDGRKICCNEIIAPTQLQMLMVETSPCQSVNLPFVMNENMHPFFAEELAKFGIR